MFLSIKKEILPAVILFFTFFLLSTMSNAAVHYSGTRKVFVDSSDSINLKQTAHELINYLNKIDTGKWSISDKKYAGNGIYLGITKSAVLSTIAKNRLNEMKLAGYMIKPEVKSIQIVGNTALAVQHGMFDFLERLGCRFLTPAEAWTIIPSKTGIIVASGKTFVQPDYIGRRIWYANGLGVGHSPDGSLKKINETYKQFERTTRQESLAPLSFGHSYFSTYIRHKKEFDSHPEWAGMKQDGTRPPLNALRGRKFSRNWCYSNPELAKLCLEDRIALLGRMRKKNPYARMVSMDTNDGAEVCYCKKCQKLGNASDQALYLANYVARGIRKVYPDALVGILIYPPHNIPPKNIRLEPNIIPSMAMAFNRTGMSYAELLQGWLKAGTRQVAIYEYFGVYEWDYGMPAQSHITYNYIRKAIPHFFKKWKAISLSAQSQASWGRYGPSMYLARKLLWDINADAETVYNEYFTSAFGKAAPQMRKLFDMWDTPAGGKLTDKNLARWLTMMQQAVDEAKNGTPQVQRRLEDMMSYLHVVVLYHKARQAQALPKKTDAEKTSRSEIIRKRVGDLLNFVWRTRERQMMQFWGFMTRLGTFGREIHALVWKKWASKEIRQGTAEWMTSNKDYSSQEIADFFKNDLKEYSVYLQNLKVYSAKLAPLYPDKPAVHNQSRGYFTKESTWYFYLQKASLITITLGGKSPKGNFFKKIIVTNSDGKVVFSHIPELYEVPDRTLKAVKLRLPPGTYRLIMADDKKRYFPVFTPAVKNVYEQSELHSSFNQYFTPGYFYVPKGIKTLKISNSLCLSLKAPSWQKKRTYNAGMLSIPVGNDSGKVWKITYVTRAEFILLNIPPYIANKQDNLLVPAGL